MTTARGSQQKADRSDFSKGKMWKIILTQSIPLCLAQLVYLLYNVVDRIYIGHMGTDGSMALTGVGLAFPLTTLIAAFTALFGNGGAPIFAIARGAGREKEAEEILGQVTALLLGSSVILMALCYIFRHDILYLFGASDASYVYADQYLQIYLLGTMFAMLSSGLNGFINAQGFPKTGMGTIVVGAALNLVLDPLFIYGFHMGVRGAAIATVISQFVSAAWVIRFFFSPKTLYRIRTENMRLKWYYLKDILSLGAAGFIVQGTNCLVQVVCNKTLQMYGGDIYVSAMTVINSVREILSLPANGISSGAQPVLGFNLGARKYKRVRQGVRLIASICFVYMAIAWILVLIFPEAMMGIFTTDRELIAAGTGALKLYFFGFFFMAFQFTGQSTFTALKCPKRSIFFSLFRKVIIVVPLTILLPQMGYGVNGVFLAEPVSNLVGGLASFTTMYLTLYRKLPDRDEA